MIGDPIAVTPAPAVALEPAPAPKKRLPSSVAERKRIFALEFLKDENATKAAERTGFSPRSARNQGNRMMKDDDVIGQIVRLRQERAERVQMEGDDVLRELKYLVEADPRELVEHVIDCCRYCHGDDHRYQRTAKERSEAYRLWTDAEEDASKVRDRRKYGSIGDPESFDELGGLGFDPRRAPDPNCPECFGRGVPKTIVHDQRTISPRARRLLAGVKATKDGIEVKMHDVLEALQMIGRANGIFRDNVDLTTMGKQLPPGLIQIAFVESHQQRPAE